MDRRGEFEVSTEANQQTPGLRTAIFDGLIDLGETHKLDIGH